MRRAVLDLDERPEWRTTERASAVTRDPMLRPTSTRMRTLVVTFATAVDAEAFDRLTDQQIAAVLTTAAQETR